MNIRVLFTDLFRIWNVYFGWSDPDPAKSFGSFRGVSDPDPAFQAENRSGSNLDPGFWWLEIEKNLQLKKKYIFLDLKLQFTSVKDKKPSAHKREHPAL